MSHHHFVNQWCSSSLTHICGIRGRWVKFTCLSIWENAFSSTVYEVMVSGNVNHDSDVIMGVMASQITSLTIVYSTVYSGADQRKHQSFATLAFVRGIHRWPGNSPHKWPVTRKMFPFDDGIILVWSCQSSILPITYPCVHVHVTNEFLDSSADPNKFQQTLGGQMKWYFFYTLHPLRHSYA